jgi:hypothetical protein
MTSGKRNPDVRENPRVYSGSINQMLDALIRQRQKEKG